MAETNTGQDGPATRVTQAAHNFIQSFAMVFSQINLYGAGHSVTQQAIDRSYTVLNVALKEKEALNLSVSDQMLLVDGANYEGITPAITAFVERMMKLDIASFSVDRGIPPEEFKGIIELLCATPDEMKQAGGFAIVLGTLGLQHVRAKRVSFQRVTEDEVVVAKDKLAQAIGGISASDVDKVSKVLRGEAQDLTEEEMKSLEAASSDVSAMSGMVADAAGVSKDAPAGEAADVGENVVAVMRRLYDRLSGTQRSQTQKGKKELIKLLEELEKGVSEEINKRAAQENGQAAKEKLSQAVEEMMDELRIDSLTSEYAKKKGGVQTSEKRIMRFIKTAGTAALEKSGLVEKLLAEGMTEDDVGELLERCGVDMSAKNPEAEKAEAENRRVWQDLSVNLSRIEKALATSGVVKPQPAVGEAPAPAAPVKDVGEIVSQASEIVTKMTAITEKKIAAFAEKIKPAKAGGPAKPAPSRKAVFEFLAEVVQELRQPLAVITSVMSAVNSGMMGELAVPQKSMLNLACESAKRLDHLVDKLAEVSGMPSGLIPDAKILGAVYNRPPDSQGGGQS